MLDWAVLIPAHDAESTVAEAVASALSQAHPPRVVAVYDDGSRDATSAAAALAPEVRVIRGQTNHGVGWARNRLLEATESGWVLFLDADDVLLQDASRCIMRAVAASTAAVGVHAFAATGYPATAAPQPATHESRRIQHEDLWHRNGITSSGAVIRRAALVSAGEYWGHRRLVDYDMWFRMARLPGVELVVHDLPVAARRISDRSITAEVNAAVVVEKQLLEREVVHLPVRASSRRRVALLQRLTLLWLRGYVRHVQYGGHPGTYLSAAGVVAPQALAGVLDLARTPAGSHLVSSMRRLRAPRR